MTRRFFSVVAVGAALALFTPLFVTASASEINCRIPFSFTVSGKTLPAGFYSFATRDNVLTVRGLRSGVVVMTRHMQSSTEKGIKTVFVKIGDRYELVEAWTADGAGLELVLPRGTARDRMARKTGDRIVIAGM